jgi:FMN reductase
MPPFRLVAVSGNTHRPSKSQQLASTIVEALPPQSGLLIEYFDIVDAGPGLGGSFRRDELPEAAARIIKAIEQADGLVIAVPVYKGSYPGLFKHLIDFVDPLALEKKPVALAATVGSPRHALVIEHQLRPLFGFFAAQTLPTGVVVADADFQNGAIVDDDALKRIGVLAAELDASIRQWHVRASSIRAPLAATS